MIRLGYFSKQCLRELFIYSRQPRLLLNATLFFIMIVIFFPLTLPPIREILRQIAPGLVWMALLLALLLASERMFQQDYEEGVIEQWLISGHSLSVIITAKMLVHWVMTLIPVFFLCPILTFLFDFTGREIFILLMSLLLGTPAILALCVLAAAFSTSLQQKGIFMALILLPLAIPVMIFGSGTVIAAMQGFHISAYLAILAALSILAVGLLPFATAAIIRISLH